MHWGKGSLSGVPWGQGPHYCDFIANEMSWSLPHVNQRVNNGAGWLLWLCHFRVTTGQAVICLLSDIWVEQPLRFPNHQMCVCKAHSRVLHSLRSLNLQDSFYSYHLIYRIEKARRDRKSMQSLFGPVFPISYLESDTPCTLSPAFASGGLMLKLKLQYFGHLMGRANSLEKTLILGKTEGRKRGHERGWDGWMASLIQWIWVWANSGR